MQKLVTALLKSSKQAGKHGSREANTEGGTARTASTIITAYIGMAIPVVNTKTAAMHVKQGHAINKPISASSPANSEG